MRFENVQFHGNFQSDVMKFRCGIFYVISSVLPCIATYVTQHSIDNLKTNFTFLTSSHIHEYFISSSCRRVLGLMRIFHSSKCSAGIQIFWKIKYVAWWSRQIKDSQVHLKVSLFVSLILICAAHQWWWRLENKSLTQTEVSVSPQSLVVISKIWPVGHSRGYLIPSSQT